MAKERDNRSYTNLVRFQNFSEFDIYNWRSEEKRYMKCQIEDHFILLVDYREYLYYRERGSKRKRGWVESKWEFARKKERVGESDKVITCSFK